MRPKSMVLILIALGCGLIASIGISQVMESQKRSGNALDIPMQPIYVAVTDIPINQQLDAQMVQLEDWPKDRVPYGAITKLESIEGRVPRQPLYKGEPILEPKLIDPKRDQGVASANIAPGYRAFSIRVDMESGASNLIQPGDHVDVLLHLPSGPGVPQTTARTILKDVTVFAVNDQISRTTDQGDTTLTAKTVTLQVKPEEVEKLMLAKNLGRLQLSLRRPTDDRQVEHTPGATLSSLDPALDSSSPDFPFEALSKGGLPAPPDKGLAGFLNKITQSGRPGSDSISSSSFPDRPDMKMAVITPEGISTYTWDSRDSLPRELALDPAAPGRGEDGSSSVVLPMPPPGVNLPDDFLPEAVEATPPEEGSDGDATSGPAI